MHVTLQQSCSTGVCMGTTM